MKRTLHRLIKDAQDCGVQAVLYGHTHIPDCRLEDGLWILNPGSCGYGSRTGAVIETEGGKIRTCRILTQEDVEEAL